MISFGHKHVAKIANDGQQYRLLMRINKSRETLQASKHPMGF